MAPTAKRRKFSHRSNGSGNPQIPRVKPEIPPKRRLAETARVTVTQSTSNQDAECQNNDSNSDEGEGRENHRASYRVLLQSFRPGVDRRRKREQSDGLGNESYADLRVDRQSDSDEVDDSEELKISAEALSEDEREIESIEGAETKEDDASDFFVTHFENADESILSNRLKAMMEERWIVEKIKLDPEWRVLVSFPDTNGAGAAAFKRRLQTLTEVQLKQKLLEPSLKIIPNFNDVQAQVAPSIFNYADLLYTARSVQNADSLRNIICVHALNHTLKTRDRVIKNTVRLAREQLDTETEIRDQGFTRPKVLILLETRQSCVRYMDTISSLFTPEQEENKKRFQDAFLQTENRFPEDKPEDFMELFQGNDDNDFRLGIKFTRKTIKYYSQFYSSDLILASPLGLRRAIKPEDPKATDYDFLSSIEIVIIDQADAMLMQNWEHVGFALDKLNLQPREPHGCDFSRVRKWSLDQHARYLRQTIVLSAFLTPELNSVYSQRMLNTAGKVKIHRTSLGSMLSINTHTPHGPITQTFVRFASPSPSTDPDARFNYFVTAVLPSLLPAAAPYPPHDQPPPRTVLFIPSYLDYTRLRNHLTSSSAPAPSFASITEYTPTSAIARARSHFLSGASPLLLYTARAHHFRRFRRMNGAARVLFYGLPAHPAFYAEVAAFLAAAGGDVRVLFSRWDALALERVVGTARVAGMLGGGVGDRFEFR